MVTVKLICPDKPELVVNVPEIIEVGAQCFTTDGTRTEYRCVTKVVPAEVAEIHLSAPRPLMRTPY